MVSFFFSTFQHLHLENQPRQQIIFSWMNFFQNFYPEGNHQEFIVWIHNLLVLLCFFSFLSLFLCIYGDCLSVKKKEEKTDQPNIKLIEAKKKKKILPVIRNHLVSIIIIIIGQIVIFDQWLWWWWCYWELIKDTHIFL